MPETIRLPEGSVLTVTAHEPVVATQVQDSTITASLADGAAQSFGPYPLGRDFLITGNAVVAIADAALGGEALSFVSITANATISRLHHNKMLRVNKGTDVTLTLPNDLPQGFACVVVQIGVGLAIFAAASGAAKHNRQSFDRTAGQWAEMPVHVDSNADGSSAVWVLGGDGATA